jgi:hypothetical protein
MPFRKKINKNHLWFRLLASRQNNKSNNTKNNTLSFFFRFYFSKKFYFFSANDFPSSTMSRDAWYSGLEGRKM